MMKRSNYNPTEIDIAWAHSFLQLTADDAVWGWPNTGLIYRISHTNKTLTLINSDLLSDPHAESGHNMTIQVFSKVGYKVLDK